MPIPDFDHNCVLPPVLGNPAVGSQNLSPYPASCEEVCRRFGTSPERRAILVGWLGFRRKIREMGITSGFQWLDGSFAEDIERSEDRQPNDLDLITFFRFPPDFQLAELRDVFPEFQNRVACRARFRLDHFPIHLGMPSESLVETVRYWTGLFSHRRDGVWKGMLRVELNTPSEDDAAERLLR